MILIVGQISMIESLHTTVIMYYTSSQRLHTSRGKGLRAPLGPGCNSGQIYGSKEVLVVNRTGSTNMIFSLSQGKFRANVGRNSTYSGHDILHFA